MRQDRLLTAVFPLSMIKQESTGPGVACPRHHHRCQAICVNKTVHSDYRSLTWGRNA